MKFTDNYNLDLYEMEDNANMADGYNHTVNKIDALLFQLQSMISTNIEAVSNLQTAVASLETRVTNLEKKA